MSGTWYDVGGAMLSLVARTNNKIQDNVIYGEPRTGSNVGIYVWNQSSSPCSGAEVSGNRVHFQKPDATRSGYWTSGNCGTVAGSGNDYWAPLVLSNLRVAL